MNELTEELARREGREIQYHENSLEISNEQNNNQDINESIPIVIIDDSSKAEPLDFSKGEDETDSFF